jgi:hypothetical protein
MRTFVLAFALALAAAACGENQTPVATHDPYVPGELPPLECLPNVDGRLDANEMPVALGVTTSSIASPANTTRAVDTAGFVDADGHRVWDWGADFADDQLARYSASELAGKWYAASFPGGQFVAPFDLGGRTQGIYSKTEEALYLHGLASTESDPAEGRTLYVYDEPVALFRFPIAPGAEWTSRATVRNGLIRGIPYAARDTYQVRVDASGRLILPDMEFTQAHRVRVLATIEPAVGPTLTTWQTIFLSECFGEVARATSLIGEAQQDFTTAAELRRLGL